MMEWLHEEEDSAIDDIDFPKTFAEEFAQQIQVETRNTMERIANMWVEMGLSSHRIDSRIEDIRELFIKVCNNSIQTESKSLQELITYKETKLNEINVILSDLTLPLFIVPTDLSLMQVSKLLYNKCNELLEVKNERMSQLTELKSKRDALCVALNVKVKPFKTLTNIPSEEELMNLQSYVSDLSKEKAKRFNKYQSIKKIIESLFIELEREVTNDFEKWLLFEDSDKFVLSEENMKKLHNLHSELECIYANNNEKRKQMENRLNSLWNKLEVSQNYRDSFLRTKKGCKPSVLALLQEEVEKYEELKRQNIELFVEKVRNDLEEWYEKCCVSEEETLQFKPFLESNEYTEQLLEQHEQELQRLQTFYEENEEIFEKLNEWRDLWNRFIELENKMNDPNRFNNRGGALLAEERDKKQLRKRLPKLEKEMRTLSKDRFQANGHKFCVYGIEVEKYFEDQWNNYQESKENEKKERLRMKQMGIQGQLKGKKATPIGGGVVLRKTPIKRAFTPVSPGPNGSSNSKLRKMGPLTPSRLNNEADCNGGTVTKRMIPNNIAPIPRCRPRNLESQMNQVANTPNLIDGSILSIDEDEFQAPLGDRDNAHSTFISVSQKVTPSRNITKRRERPQVRQMNRRRSRSCSDLAEAVNAKLQITNSRPMPTIRSTPVSPQIKSAFNCTPSRLPRIAVAQRKRPFIV